MRLRERPIDPEVQRELDALDAALRGERVDADLADLAALAGELREARPQVRDEFGAQLDAWVAEGFPSATEVQGDHGTTKAGDARRPAQAEPGLLPVSVPGRWLLLPPVPRRSSSPAPSERRCS